MASIDFWFSIGSMYTFLAVTRLSQIAAKSGVEFEWRPFNVRAVMIEMDNIRLRRSRSKPPMCGAISNGAQPGSGLRLGSQFPTR